MDIITTNIIHLFFKEQKKRSEIKQSLSKYSFVHNLSELKIGSHIRWIDITQSPYNLCGVVMLINVSIEDTHVNITCKTFSNKFFKRRYDNLAIFKKFVEI